MLEKGGKKEKKKETVFQTGKFYLTHACT